MSKCMEWGRIQVECWPMEGWREARYVAVEDTTSTEDTCRRRGTERGGIEGGTGRGSTPRPRRHHDPSCHKLHE